MQTSKNIIITQNGNSYFIPSGSVYIETTIERTPSVFYITASANTNGIHTPEIISAETGSWFEIFSADKQVHRWHFVSSSGNTNQPVITGALIPTPYVVTLNNSSDALTVAHAMISASFSESQFYENSILSESFFQPKISSLGELTLISKFSGSATLFNNMSSSTFVISQSGGVGYYEQEPSFFTLSTSSAAFSYGLDSTDNNSFILSGSSTTKLYFSGSGKIGINTTDPQSGFDVVSDEVQFQKPGSRKGLKINDEGNIESFNKDAESAATGSEFILKYSRGAAVTQASLDALGIIVANDAGATSYFNALRPEEQNIFLEKLERKGLITLPEAGDTIGSIRFIAESGSLAGFNSRVAGEAALIKAVVNSIDATGVQSDLIFSVASKGSSSQQKLLLDAGNNHELTGSLNISQGVIATSFTGLNISASGYLVAQNITSSANISASGTITAFSSNIVTINGGSF
jgi:hypothetical protein